MFRTTDIILIGVMVAAAGFTYTTKHGAEAELAKLRNLEEQIRLERDAIDILNADWSLLTQPSRLQRLIETFEDDLELHPVEAYQYAEMDELPPPVLGIEEVIRQAGEGTGPGALDDLATGAVSQ